MAFNGTRLAELRSRTRLTQAQLAQRLDTDQARVSDWERGVSVPRPHLVPQIAEALDVDALDLLGSDPAAPLLEDLRLAAGMTRPELAQAIGITNQRYRRLELGTRLRQLDSEIVDALARALAVPPVTVLASLDAGHQ